MKIRTVRNNSTGNVRGLAITFDLHRKNGRFSNVNDEQSQAAQIRRRTEDILEGLRLERDALDEVWD